MSGLFRYPGVRPFEASDGALFFGRDRDKADLLMLMEQKKLAVLFGKSGYGKSSLLKAALMPELEKTPFLRPDPATGDDVEARNRPIYVRFKLFNKSENCSSPIETIVQRLSETYPENAAASGETAQFFEQKKLEKRLWHRFKNFPQAASERIFLILDQFEEFFSYPPEDQLRFRKELAELLYAQLPQDVRDAMDGLDAPTKRRLYQPLDVRVLISTRSDRLHLLNGMRDELTDILTARHELKALTESQATEAITRPAQLEGPQFSLPNRFDFEPQALAQILAELQKPREDDAVLAAEAAEKQPIESFHLQMVCEKIERGLLTRASRPKAEQPTLVTEADLPDFRQLYHQYYAGKIAEIADAEQRRAAHILLEEEMVIGEGLAEMRRVSLPKDVLTKMMHDEHRIALEQLLLNFLEDKFLIRRETFGPNVHYEVSHDVLLAPIFRARTAARQRKAEAAAAENAAERQREAETAAAEALEKQKLEFDRRREKSKRKTLLALLILASAVVLGLTFLGGWALMQKKEAEKQAKEAETARKETLDALEKLKKANLEKERLEFLNTLQAIENILMSDDACPDRKQREQLEKMPPRFVGDGEIEQKTAFVRKKMKTKNCD